MHPFSNRRIALEQTGTRGGAKAKVVRCSRCDHGWARNAFYIHRPTGQAEVKASTRGAHPRFMNSYELSLSLGKTKKGSCLVNRSDRAEKNTSTRVFPLFHTREAMLGDTAYRVPKALSFQLNDTCGQESATTNAENRRARTTLPIS